LTEALANFEEITNIKEWREKRDDPKKINFEDSRTFAFEKVGKVFMPLVYDEITNLIPEWKDLSIQEDGFVTFHTILVVWLTTRDSLYADCSAREKNILLWATLIHDIRKR
jgi:hypothetical protein